MVRHERMAAKFCVSRRTETVDVCRFSRDGNSHRSFHDLLSIYQFSDGKSCEFITKRITENHDTKLFQNSNPKPSEGEDLFADQYCRSCPWTILFYNHHVVCRE